jgi:hypothetical protein
MSKPTLTSVTEQIHSIDTRTHRLETETHIQFKDIYNRFRRIETILISSAGATLLLLISIIFQL